jgi:NitT/TauT family transport system ATP-binding protein
LEIRAVTKSFRSAKGDLVPVLEELSFEVEELEFLALLGPSGCGKSTLLRVIDGLTPCDSGQILMNGRDITGVGTGREGAMVFQSFDLYPWRTVLENVEFGLEVFRVPKAERKERAHRYIKLVGLEGFEDAYPHQLSGGMQQRVGTARALAIDPQILLMDEPFGALDVQTRDILQDELLRIWQRERKTVLFVTHSIEEAIYLADRIFVFSPRPARIERTIEVPFPRPRSDGIKATPEFLELRRDIWQTLKRGVQV